MFGSISTDTVTIDAPLAVVWAVYSDIEHWPEWTASVTTARLEPRGPLALGSRASIKQPRFPRVTWTVTDIEPATFVAMGESFGRRPHEAQTTG